MKLTAVAFKVKLFVMNKSKMHQTLQTLKKETLLRMRMLNTRGLALISKSFIVKAIYDSDEITKKGLETQQSHFDCFRSWLVYSGKIYGMFSNVCFPSLNIKDISGLLFFLEGDMQS